MFECENVVILYQFFAASEYKKNGLVCQGNFNKTWDLILFITDLKSSIFIEVDDLRTSGSSPQLSEYGIYQLPGCTL